MLDFLMSNEMFVKFAVIVTVARGIFKPLCSAINKYVEESETLSDNELWSKIQDNKIFKSVAWLMDYVASVKLPK